MAAHWYNLGATLYRAGADGKATAAWTIAARLAPRERVVRRARDLLPFPDAASEPLLAVGLATPAECWLLAGALWITAWVLVLLGRRRLVPGAMAALTVAVVVLGAVEWRRRARPVAVVVAAGTAVRVAPYGVASAASSVDAGAALVVEDQYGRWLEVRRADGIHGWLLATEVVQL